jgi:hypothetical protein
LHAEHAHKITCNDPLWTVTSEATAYSRPLTTGELDRFCTALLVFGW